MRDQQDKQDQHGDRNAERKVTEERGGTERASESKAEWRSDREMEWKIDIRLYYLFALTIQQEFVWQEDEKWSPFTFSHVDPRI